MPQNVFLATVDWSSLAVAIGLTLGIAYGAAQLAARLTAAALRATVGGDRVALESPSIRRPIRMVRAVVFVVTGAGLIAPALALAGFELSFGSNPTAVATWLIETGVRTALIALGAYVLIRVIGVIVLRFESEVAATAMQLDMLERAKRARTLGKLVQTTAAAVIVGIATLMILRELQVDIMPVLTGAGIVGLAVGFGAQALVRDIIGGFFLILENQVRVGDVAVINGTGGLVEQISLRTIVLRDLEGTVHVFPNGSIERLANRTRDFSYYVVNVGVGYKEDTDEVVAALREVGEDLRNDPAFAPHILEPLEILGVDDFGEAQVTIKIRIKTVPLKQWEVGRELRRRIKKMFDARKIEIPFPHVTVLPGETDRPWVVRHVSEPSREAPIR